MRKSGHSIGKLFFLFAGICILVLPVIIFKALSAQTVESIPQVNNQPIPDFDHQAKLLYGTYNNTTPDYMAGTSTSRTLEYYYSLRQYPGSPPVVPHILMDEKSAQLDCLSCHLQGGFAESFNRFTPVTPHPQHESCNQCHVKREDSSLFTGIDWFSVMPPRLGRSALAGSPPPIAHPLQMRENCVACHVGPGAVVSIRVEHPMRGNCRQCHVPAETQTLFSRDFK
jgi:cytochrome c-type protein NapB